MPGNNCSYLFLSVLGISLIILGVYFPRRSILESFARHPAREALIDRALCMPLGKMLAKCNIDLRYYFVSQSTADVSEHIRNCAHCDHIEECDNFLTDDNLHDVDNIPFCPNSDAISRVKQIQQDMRSKIKKRKQVRSHLKRAFLLPPSHWFTKQ
jgi:hypothetical protein